MTVQTGEVIDGRFIVEQRLGAGGAAEVFAVRHRTLQTLFVLKVLTIRQKSVQRRLILEGKVQSGLRHPHIVGVSDVVEVHGMSALVLEYVHGPNLATVIQSAPPGTCALSLPQCDAIAAALFDALEAAHRQGVVHRDIKPHNVLLALNAGQVTPKLADFGLALEPGESEKRLTRTGSFFGTPEYMSPEQIRDVKSTDARSDQFSLGVLLFELVSGVRPFSGSDTIEIISRVAANERPPFRTVAPAAPDRVALAIERALSPAPADRFTDVAEMRAAWFEGATRGAPRWDVAALETILARERASSHAEWEAEADEPSVSVAEAAVVPSAVPPAATLLRPAAAPVAASNTIHLEDLGAASVTPPPPRPTATDPDQSPPEQIRHPALRWVAGAVVVGAGVLALAVALLATLRTEPDGPAAPAPAAPEPMAADAAPVPVPAAPVVPAPATTPVTSGSPRNEGTPAPAASGTPRVETPSPVPAVARPEPPPVSPTPLPVGERTRSEGLVTTREPPPAPATTAFAPAQVRFLGANDTAGVRTPQNDLLTRSQLNALPPGIYDVVVFFAPNVPTVVHPKLQLNPGDIVSIQCSEARKQCTIKR